MSTPGIAVAGSNVPSGALTSPGGAQGIPGVQGLQGIQGIPGNPGVSADAGNLAKVGSDSLILVPAAAVLPFYGVDTTNSTAYAVTVGSNFSLSPGVIVWVQTSLLNAVNPTLNVNGTGALSLRNRANLTLFANEIRPGTFGAVYDGTVWRIFTPLTRGIQLAGNQTGTYTLNCAGFDGVNFYTGIGVGFTLALQNVNYGVPITIRFYAGVSNATYAVTCTDPAGVAKTAYWCWANGVIGATLVTLTTAQTMTTAGYQMIMTGVLEYAGSVMFL